MLIAMIVVMRVGLIVAALFTLVAATAVTATATATTAPPTAAIFAALFTAVFTLFAVIVFGFVGIAVFDDLHQRRQRHHLHLLRRRRTAGIDLEIGADQRIIRAGDDGHAIEFFQLGQFDALAVEQIDRHFLAGAQHQIAVATAQGFGFQCAQGSQRRR